MFERRLVARLALAVSVLVVGLPVAVFLLLVLFVTVEVCQRVGISTYRAASC